MDFLASIAPPVVSQPQAFSDTMLDPASRGIMAGLTTAHMSGTTLQSVVRQSADQLQRTVQGQFVSLKVRNTLTTALVVFTIGHSHLFVISQSTAAIRNDNAHNLVQISVFVV